MVYSQIASSPHVCVTLSTIPFVLTLPRNKYFSAKKGCMKIILMEFFLGARIKTGRYFLSSVRQCLGELYLVKKSCFGDNNYANSVIYRMKSHLEKELLINDTPYGLRVLATDQPVNKSVGSCPKDITTHKLNQLVALHESIWMGANPDWATLQIQLGRA